NHFGSSITQRVADRWTIGDQSGFRNFVVHARTEVKTCDVSRRDNRLLGEKMQSSGEQDCAAEGTERRKAKAGRAHNYHSYKNDNTLPARFLAIQIFLPVQTFFPR